MESYTVCLRCRRSAHGARELITIDPGLFIVDSGRRWCGGPARRWPRRVQRRRRRGGCPDPPPGRLPYLWFAAPSQRSPALGPIARLGWRLFGRRIQLRFYRQCDARLRRLVQDRLAGATAPASVLHEGDLVLAPSGIHPTAGDLLTVRWHHPGT
ncbi:hypothetical protein [Saccharopolyspora hattusasensis]|uniref:hypothetical protein n=1 Tax=Saccharopolyspora hattusasensis TaxID=1128679 RepID=UPI003D95A953